MPGRSQFEEHELVFFLTALLVVVTDQLTKSWIRSTLALGESVPPSGFFQIVHARNTGAVFGLFPNHSLALTFIASAGAIVMLYFALSFVPRSPLLNTIANRTALGLIFGGTIGNLTDRISLGYVTDFISIGIWPAFNVADSSVTVGTAVFGYFLLRWAVEEKSSHDRSVSPHG